MNESACPFCSIDDQIQYETKNALAILDKYPVTRYHTLIIPKRHVDSFFNMNLDEYSDCIYLMKVVKSTLSKLDPTISGFNMGVNDGYDAGQTVNHCHIHLIPRRSGDVPDPRGGIRHIIPEKGFYQKN